MGGYMPQLMRYRLALDIGSTSIGWAMIRLSMQNEPIAIIRMGVRIFSDGRNPKDGSSLAVTRRVARQMRRRRDRLLKRKTRLLNALVQKKFFPEDADARKALVVLNPYELRKEGLYRQLSGPEFGRALFHISQRRGFLSNRKTDKKDNDSSVLKKAIVDLRQQLEVENCQTIGEWLFKQQQSGKSVRARLRGKTQKDKAYDFYIDRAMIAHEFDTLWVSQAKYDPLLFNEDARAILRDILLYQRPLKPVKPGRCTLIPDESRAPLALPLTQQARIYQELNHLRITTPALGAQALTVAQRNTIAALLEKSDVTFVKIAKALGLTSTTEFNLQDIKRDRLKGNATAIILARNQYFGRRWHDFNADLQNLIVDKLVNEGSETALIEWLKANTDVDESAAERVSGVTLPEGYGSLSVAALRRLLPALKEDVVVYSEAVKRAGFDSHSALSLIEQTGELYQELPYYGEVLQRHVGFGSGDPNDSPERRFGKIANPTVHIGLNELRKIINALIKRYGNPAEVVVELARDLKLSREKRKEIQEEQKQRQDRNEKRIKDACEILGIDPLVIDRGKRREISQKMQLWDELNPKDAANRRCPYTGDQISIEKLLSAEVEIEHILPFSKTLDDSLNNKTVAMRRANRDKGNRTPYEAFGESLNPDYDYDAILQRASLMPREKRKRFASDGYQQWLRDDKDFLSRALNDTAYLSRIAKEYLTLICPPNSVRAIPGRMTAQLRAMFGLNRLLSEGGIKNREDHRHHAIDAAVIGVTDQGLLQKFSRASARTRELQLSRLVDDMPLPWDTYREHVTRALEHLVVSHKPDHGYQGKMHEDTAWGLRDNGQVTRRVRSEDGGPRQRLLENKNVVKINSTRDFSRHGIDEQGQVNAYKGYVGGSNYCIEIWIDEKGKWNSDVVSTFQAYQIVRELGEKAAWQKLRNPLLSLSAKPLVMRLIIDDVVKMQIAGQNKIMRVVKIAQNGQIFFAEHNEANVDARDKDKNNPFKYISKTAGSLQKAGGIHMAISPIGDARPVRYGR
ncbi:Uncharacterized protein conserved in bacteria [gamma proteobacterium HdN1]|nr:Uncharacterized protein conserved in bacteria [gamma proteobacterium HdN1]